MKYVVIHFETGTISMFELLFDGNSADSTIHNFWGPSNPAIPYFLLQLSYSAHLVI